MKFNTNKKCSVTFNWSNPVNCICVFDDAMDVYFLREFDEPVSNYSINLPCQNSFNVIPDPDTITIGNVIPVLRKIDIPEPDRSISVMPEFVYDNSNPEAVATCLINEGIILLRKPFYDKPYFVREFIIKHEMAHFYYDDEKNADKMALVSYCNEGFNPTSAYIALNGYLTKTPENIDRINSLFNTYIRYKI